jgi:hypothetical protein
MTRIHRVLVCALTVVILTLASGPVRAVCVIDPTGLVICPVTASTGIYTPPTTPTAQPVSFSITGTYTSVAGGTCTVAISYNRASLPASMAISGGGGATLPYTITSAAGGGNTLLYTGGGTPAAANLLTFAFAPSPLGVNQPFTANLTAYFLAQPVAFQAAGSYSDSLTVHIFDVTVAAVATDLANRAFTVTGTVASVCTIGGAAHPAADTAAIAISAAGAVNTAPIPKSYLNAACNGPANLQLTSQNGAVTTAGTLANFSNLIDYTATASFSGANATINTAATATASGPESGAAVAATGTTPTGTLSVTITLHANSKPLLAGAYLDTLTIVIIPQ